MKDNHSQKKINLENFFSVNLDLFCVADLNGNFVKMSRSWNETLGYPDGVLEGSPFMELVHPDDQARTGKVIRNLEKSIPISNFIVRFRHRDGTYRFLEWRAMMADSLIYATARDLTERKAVDDKLLQLSKAVEFNPATIVITDRDANIVYVNDRFLELTGYGHEEIIGKNARVLQSGEYKPDFYESLWKVLLSGDSWKGVFHNRKKDGTLYWESALISPILDEAGTITHYVAMKEDITAQKKAEESLEESRQLLDLFFRQSLDGFFFMMLDEPVEWNDDTDKETVLDYVFTHQKITKINSAMLDQYKAKEEDFLGLTPADFFKHDPGQGRKVWRQFFDDGKLHIDTREERFDGTTMVVEGDYICIYDSHGRITGHFGVQRDVTFEREAREALEESEKKLREMAVRDPLTGLYNRRYVYERLLPMAEKAKRDGTNFSLAMIDIDNFKSINDTYGHIAGDAVLKHFSSLLLGNLRSYDILGRFGGEEFIIVFLDTSRNTAAEKVERILSIVGNSPVNSEGQTLSYTFSAGVSDFLHFPDKHFSVDRLISRSDEKLYKAKKAGKNRVVI
jgi:diguanylate cyclase (GGDEF)-like protein/PAS domain S-box-containing protein